MPILNHFHHQGKESLSQVFISYQWAIKADILRLHSRLTSQGFSCWIDEKKIRGGDEMDSKIVNGITNAKVCISHFNDPGQIVQGL